MYSDLQKEAFNRSLEGRVQKLIDASCDPGAFRYTQYSYFYDPKLNFGELFRFPRHATPIEAAYFDARDNFPGVSLALIVSRPHDNIYMFADSAEVYCRIVRQPVLMYDLWDAEADATRHMWLANFKTYLDPEYNR